MCSSACQWDFVILGALQESYVLFGFLSPVFKKGTGRVMICLVFMRLFSEGQRGRVMICLIFLSYFSEKGREGE